MTHPRQSKLIGKLSELEITQEQLSEIIDVVPSTANQMLQGKTDFRFSKARLIKEHLENRLGKKMTYDELFI